MKFQKSLMRLKIPKLEDSLRRYVDAVSVILPEDAARQARLEALAFRSGVGEELQRRLVASDKSNRHTSYITKHWFDMYLTDRRPVVLNHTPFMMFHPDPVLNDPLRRATAVLVSTARFMRTLRANLLEPEVYHMNPAKTDTPFFRNVVRCTPEAVATYAALAFKAFPLDMSQFGNLLNSTRLPAEGKDRLACDPTARHTLVVRNGNFYVFDVLDESGRVLPPPRLLAALQHIAADAAPPARHPLGVLTAAGRDTWAKARASLEAAGNAEALNTLDRACFCLVLDDATVAGCPDAAYRTFLHGRAENRWFDKSFSMVVTADAQLGLNFEHSWGDGVAVMRYINEVSSDMAAHAGATAAMEPAEAPKVSRLRFAVPEDVAAVVAAQRSSFQERTAALGVNILETDVLGKQRCKAAKVSPDAVMQLGIQLANRLQLGRDVATYESCSTSAFKHGRTETIRPATKQTAAFCDAVLAGKKATELRPLLEACSTKHNQLTKEAAMGDGFDRHLFALRKICEADGGELPSLFTGKAYTSLNHNILSTSTLSSPHIAFGGFGPVVEDGFGIGYSIQADKLGLVVSSFPPHRDGAGFVKSAEEAYEAIRGAMTA